MNLDLYWLPPLVLFEDSGGDWAKYEEVLYAWFRRDFVDSKPTFPGKRMGLKRHPVIKGKEATFWHFISEGKIEADRSPDLRRCERIRWPRKIIDAYETNNVRWWKNERNGEPRVIIAICDFSYVVVLADRGEYILPWTAYCVEQNHRREKLKREFEAY